MGVAKKYIKGGGHIGLGSNLVHYMKGCSDLVVKALNFQSRGPVFKTTGWLQGQLSLSSFQGQQNEY